MFFSVRYFWRLHCRQTAVSFGTSFCQLYNFCIFTHPQHNLNTTSRTDRPGSCSVLSVCVLTLPVCFRWCSTWSTRWLQTRGATSASTLLAGCRIRGWVWLMEPTRETWSSAGLCESLTSFIGDIVHYCVIVICRHRLAGAVGCNSDGRDLDPCLSDISESH